MAEGEVKVPIGADTEPIKKSLEETKGYINQFGEQIKVRIGGAFQDTGKRAADAIYDYVKNLGSMIATMAMQSTDAFARYDATKRAGAMVAGMPGAEYAAGTPEGKKQVKAMMEAVRPIAEREAAGAAFIRGESGEPAALAALLGIHGQLQEINQKLPGGVVNGGGGR